MKKKAIKWFWWGIDTAIGVAMIIAIKYAIMHPVYLAPVMIQAMCMIMLYSGAKVIEDDEDKEFTFPAWQQRAMIVTACITASIVIGVMFIHLLMESFPKNGNDEDDDEDEPRYPPTPPRRKALSKKTIEDLLR